MYKDASRPHPHATAPRSAETKRATLHGVASPAEQQRRGQGTPLHPPKRLTRRCAEVGPLSEAKLVPERLQRIPSNLNPIARSVARWRGDRRILGVISDVCHDTTHG